MFPCRPPPGGGDGEADGRPKVSRGEETRIPAHCTTGKHNSHTLTHTHHTAHTPHSHTPHSHTHTQSYTTQFLGRILPYSHTYHTAHTPHSHTPHCTHTTHTHTQSYTTQFLGRILPYSHTHHTAHRQTATARRSWLPCSLGSPSQPQ